MPEEQGKSRGRGSPPVEHQFKPGQSGNPGGRPKDNIRSLARVRTEEAFNKIIYLMEKGNNEKIQLKAAETILAYGWGKPSQEVAMSGNLGLSENLAELIYAARKRVRLNEISD